jgi:hypothetical protein
MLVKDLVQHTTECKVLSGKTASMSRTNRVLQMLLQQSNGLFVPPCDSSISETLTCHAKNQVCYV